MSNRARPTWPDGAADSAKSPGTPPGANGKGNGQPTPSGPPASNGRTTPGSNGSTTPSKPAPAGQEAPGYSRPSSAKPAPSSKPASSAPGPAASRPAPSPAPGPAPSSTPGSGSGQTPGPGVKPAAVRPPQQPPVRPAAKQTPAAAPSATPRPGTTPSTPQRPPGQNQPKQPAAKAAYGQTPAAPASSTETISDRVTSAKQAVLEKASAVKEAATQGTTTRTPARDAKTPTTARVSARAQTRKARLKLSRLDPWSVMKTAFLLSIAFGIVTWVAVFIVWSAIGAAGVFDNINNTVSEVLGTPAAEPFRIENYINTGKVMGFTTLIACADVLIITALATLGSFLYNIAATLLGGLEVTLASED